MAFSLPMIWMESIFSFRFCAGLKRATKALVATKKFKISVNSNVALPPISGPVEPHANKSRFVFFGNSKIPAISFWSYVPEICNPVVGSIPVDVVNLLGPYSVSDEPSHAVRSHGRATKRPAFVAISVNSAQRRPTGISSVEHSALLLWRACAWLEHVRRGLVPRHVSRFRVVCDKLYSKFLSNHRFPPLADTRN